MGHCAIVNWFPCVSQTPDDPAATPDDEATAATPDNEAAAATPDDEAVSDTAATGDEAASDTAATDDEAVSDTAVTPDEATGMWIVAPEVDESGERTLEMVSVDSIARAVHLLPRFGEAPVPQGYDYHRCLDDCKSEDCEAS